MDAQLTTVVDVVLKFGTGGIAVLLFLQILQMRREAREDWKMLLTAIDKLAESIRENTLATNRVETIVSRRIRPPRDTAEN